MAISFTAITSCQQFAEVPDNASGYFSATTEQATKTSLSENWSVLWQDADKITVFAGNTAPSCYMVSKGAGTASAIFEAVSTSSKGSPLSANIAVYPYDAGMTVSSDGTVTLTIPQTQQYVAGGFAPEVNVMAAATPDVSGESFAFKNLLSIIRVSLTGTDVIQKLVFSGNNGEPVCGKATVKPVFGEEPTLSFASNAGTTLTLDCGQGVELSSNPTEFILAVPPMEYANGFKVTAFSTSGKSMDLTVSGNTVLKRSKVKTAPSAEFKGQDNDGFVHFESPELEAYCIEEFDLDGDGHLSEEEASRVTSINLDNTDIEFTSLKGIEYFVNLESLYASGEYYMYDESVGYEQWRERRQKISGTVDLTKNTKLRYIGLGQHRITDLKLPKTKIITSLELCDNLLTEFDVSEYPQLNSLNISNNRLSSLDVSANPELTNLYANSNKLAEINLSCNRKLRDLNLFSNQLASIDLSANTDLSFISLGNNNISCLDLSANPELMTLYAGNNKLTEINLSRNRKLTQLDLGPNQLTSIDLSANTDLTYLYLNSNNLSYLDVSKLPKLSRLNCGYNDNLKYLILSKEQTIENIYPVRGDSWYIPETIEIIFDDEFRITPQSCEANPEGDIVEIEVLSLKGSHISSVPDWMKLLGNVTDGIRNKYTFLVDANTSGTERSGQIVICDDGGKCHAVTITQKKQEEHEATDWRETDFRHRSLIMWLTSTAYVPCPWFAEAVEIVKEEHPDKVEVIAMHEGKSTLYFDGVDLMIQRFRPSLIPMGMVDCRKEVISEPQARIAANMFFEAAQETEDNYKAVTGISFSSAINGNKLDVDVSVYAKVAEEFKIAVVLLEDGIVADQAGADQKYVHYDVPRLNLSKSMEGDSFTVSQAGTVVPLHFSGIIPDKCVKRNCRILVYIQRKYGSQKVIQTSGYGEWYVDNCVSGRAGGSVPLALDSEGTSHLGGNEDITPGTDINF